MRRRKPGEHHLKDGEEAIRAVPNSFLGDGEESSIYRKEEEVVVFGKLIKRSTETSHTHTQVTSAVFGTGIAFFNKPKLQFVQLFLALADIRTKKFFFTYHGTLKPFPLFYSLQVNHEKVQQYIKTSFFLPQRPTVRLRAPDENGVTH